MLSNQTAFFLKTRAPILTAQSQGIRVAELELGNYRVTGGKATVSVEAIAQDAKNGASSLGLTFWPLVFAVPSDASSAE